MDCGVTTEIGDLANDIDSVSVPGFSLSTDFSNLALEGTRTGSCNTSAPSSFVSSPRAPVPDPAAADNAHFQPMTPIAGVSSMPQTPGSDQDTDSSASTLSSRSSQTKKSYPCTEENCKGEKVFGRPCDLRRHMKKHGRQTCPYCNDSINAFHKALERHLRSHHSDLAEVRANPKVWKEEVLCEGCDRRMRADNRKRHLKTCKGRRYEQT
ncbi:uncharacterized protein P884DRAFT_269574 [Thermothelomyces heterothallicus CBS 202.75]|uniref:uncharacterized protein n=1 Tax=Thermothelomyces heterothallicus CBS 202.75 TaxID=1149848 RepID=UPI003742D730